MNDINYNLERHIELVKLKEKFRNQNKSFLQEKKAEFSELLKYEIVINNHIFWKDRFEVASIMQAYLNKEMDSHEFHNIVFRLRSEHLAKCKKFICKLVFGEIKNFFPDKNSYKLKGFLSALYFECEHFETNFDEDEFYNSIKEGFLNFQKAINEE